MEKTTVLRPVQVWMMHMYSPKNKDLAAFNREIRNWLARNIGSGSWETKMIALHRLDNNEPYIEVTFDLNAEEDAMAFKLRWM